MPGCSHPFSQRVEMAIGECSSATSPRSSGFEPHPTLNFAIRPREPFTLPQWVPHIHAVNPSGHNGHQGGAPLSVWETPDALG